MNPKNFFAELKRRNVYKVAIAYGVIAWLLVQIATQTFPFLEIPNWMVRAVIVLLLLGFPIALILAWAFELTPEGLKRTEVADELPKKSERGRAWIYVVIVAGAISVGVFFLGRYTSSKQTEGTQLPAKSIAVLPFDNLSRDPDNAYFAEGVRDELLAYRETRYAPPQDGDAALEHSTCCLRYTRSWSPDLFRADFHCRARMKLLDSLQPLLL